MQKYLLKHTYVKTNIVGGAHYRPQASNTTSALQQHTHRVEGLIYSLRTVRKHTDKLQILGPLKTCCENNNCYRAVKTASCHRLTHASTFLSLIWETEINHIKHILRIKLELLQFLLQIRDVSEIGSDDTVTVRVQAVGICNIRF